MTSQQIQQAFPVGLADRLAALHRETGDGSLEELRERFLAFEGRVEKAELEGFRDRLSTRLMDNYRASASQEAFGLLYELNFRLFSNVIASRLRKFYFHLDPQDVLQEVFFNIYRYPHKFQADKDQAFRHWASMIIRNTVYKSTKDKDRELSHEHQDEEIETRADAERRGPLGEAIHEESRERCTGAYQLVLGLYLAAYEELSDRERRALQMVEIEGHPYKVAAADLGIRLENLKMVVFRARKKILRRLERIMSQASSSMEASIEARAEALTEARSKKPAASVPASRSRSSASSGSASGSAAPRSSSSRFERVNRRLPALRRVRDEARGQDSASMA